LDDSLIPATASFAQYVTDELLLAGLYIPVLDLFSQSLLHKL
jgi:hypothetical protein